MKFSSAILFTIMLGVLLFKAPTTAYASSYLGSLTCDSVWDEMQAVNEKRKSIDLWKHEIIDLWEEQKTLFKTNHPDLYSRELDKLSAIKKNFISFLITACDLEGNGDKNTTASDKIQNYLYYIHSQRVQNDRAGVNNCQVILGKPAGFFGLDNHPIHVCTEKSFARSRTSRPKDLEIEQTNMEFCFWPWGKPLEEDAVCSIIEPSAEQQCLSVQGECVSVGDGICEWKHTPESKSCFRAARKADGVDDEADVDEVEEAQQP